MNNETETKVIGMIADHPTPKAKLGGGVAYTMNSRDYKAVMCIAIAPYKQTRFAEYEYGVGTLKACGGDVGGGAARR